MVVVDTFSALLRGHYHTNNLLDFILSIFYWRLIQVSSLFCFSTRIERPTPSPPSRNKSAIGGRNLFVDDPLYLFRWHLNQVLTFKKFYLSLCLVRIAKKGCQNAQNKIFCDRETFGRHLVFSTSRIRVKYPTSSEPIRLQNN